MKVVTEVNGGGGGGGGPRGRAYPHRQCQAPPPLTTRAFTSRPESWSWTSENVSGARKGSLEEHDESRPFREKKSVYHSYVFRGKSRQRPP